MARLLLLGSKFKVLGTLDAQLLLRLALLALQTKHNLTCRLGLLVKNWLCLSTKTHLFGIVTALSLCEVGSLSRLVLAHFVNSVPLAFLTRTVGSTFLGYIHHGCNKKNTTDCTMKRAK